MDGVKCAIVEKNATKDKDEFLKQILEYNHYLVIVVASLPPKITLASPAPVIVSGSEATSEAAIAIPAAEPPPSPVA